jgi:hypothetical protein
LVCSLSQQLLKLIGDMRLLKSFVNTAAEVLGFIESSLHSLQPHVIGASSSASNGASAGPASTHAGSGASLWDHVDVRDARYASLQLRRRSPFEDELPHANWPSQDDAYLNELLIMYAIDVSGSPRSVKSSGSGGAGPAGTTAAKDRTDSLVTGLLWTTNTVAAQIAMLWVMHLRSLCSLRGVKPSEVLGAALQARLGALRDAYEVTGLLREESDATTASAKTAQEARKVCEVQEGWSDGVDSNPHFPVVPATLPGRNGVLLL